ncbi:MAG: DUF2244 domain-containing protein [Pseudomonadales bacterium]|nr:DUF2244 domain-containing protein [Pseudomonadales bacterium]
MVQFLESRQGIRLLLTPNRSLSWRGNVIIWCLLCLPVLAATLALTLAGAWMVLPFAGLELGALAAGLYCTSRDCHRKEVLTIDRDLVRLEKGHSHRQCQWEWPARYTRVCQQTSNRLLPANPRLYLQHRDTRILLAGFLNPSDVDRLLVILAGAGLTIDRRQ